MTATPEVLVGTHGMSIDDVIAVARGGACVRLSDESLAAMALTREQIDVLAHSPEPVYGVSTGFGALATRHIAAADRRQLQRSLIRSHAAGMGEPVEREVVRALMLLRLKTLASGRTGVRPVVGADDGRPAQRRHHPRRPRVRIARLQRRPGPARALRARPDGRGRGGRSGSAWRDRCRNCSPRPGSSRSSCQEKEGLALINGTDGMLGMLVMAIADIEHLCDVADLTAAMSVEGLMGTDQVYRPELHLPLRPHPGQALSAATMLRNLDGSGIVASHKADDDRVQDAYSLRCAPQVTGAVRDTVTHARLVAERELQASIDNPVVLGDGTVSSNGNFHGAPVAYVLDFLAIVVADLGSMSERRTDRMLDKNRSHGLPPFLADDPGVDSGLMIAQYTQAGLVSENKRLAVPASVDSIPSSAMQEDHVSMGWHAARKLRSAVDNLTCILAVELVAAARAIELRAPLRAGTGHRRRHRRLRGHRAGSRPGSLPGPRAGRGRGLRTATSSHVAANRGDSVGPWIHT